VDDGGEGDSTPSVEAYTADAEVYSNEIGELVKDPEIDKLWRTYLPYGFNQEDFLPALPPMHFHGLPSTREAGVHAACKEAADKHNEDSKWEILHEACEEQAEKYLLVLKNRRDLSHEALRMLKLLVEHAAKVKERGMSQGDTSSKKASASTDGDEGE